MLPVLINTQIFHPTQPSNLVVAIPLRYITSISNYTDIPSNTTTKFMAAIPLSYITSTDKYTDIPSNTNIKFSGDCPTVS